jgi:uncharacterized protein YuzE
MKIIYDQETDTMTVIFKESTVAESDEAKSGIIIDYDSMGDIVSILQIWSWKTQVVLHPDQKDLNGPVYRPR